MLNRSMRPCLKRIRETRDSHRIEIWKPNATSGRKTAIKAEPLRTTQTADLASPAALGTGAEKDGGLVL